MITAGYRTDTITGWRWIFDYTCPFGIDPNTQAMNSRSCLFYCYHLPSIKPFRRSPSLLIVIIVIFTIIILFIVRPHLRLNVTDHLITSHQPLVGQFPAKLHAFPPSAVTHPTLPPHHIISASRHATSSLAALTHFLSRAPAESRSQGDGTSMARKYIRNDNASKGSFYDRTGTYANY